VIVMDNKNLINGSSALAPKRKPYTPNVNEELERLKTQKKIKQKALAEARVLKKARIIGIIFLSFSIGVLLIGRYAAVYNMQKDIVKVKTEIHNFNMENNDLTVQLAKASNIQQIEEIAKTKLHMITPDKNKVIHTEATKDYFAKNTNDDKKNKQGDFIARIKNILF
jgi:cell division protein FtsL